MPGEEVVLCNSSMLLPAGMSAWMNAPLSAGATLLVVPEHAHVEELPGFPGA